MSAYVEYMNLYDGRSKFLVNRPHHNFKNFRVYLNELIQPGWRVLDYGCGHGSLGFIGRDEKTGVVVDGYDNSCNVDATYHKIEDIKGPYDAVILCHILEHVDLDECLSIINWSKKYSDRLIIVLPNTTNFIMSVIFDVDIQHKDKYDNPDFLSILENMGYHVSVTRCDIVGFDSPNLLVKWVRFGFNVLMGLSPFFNYFIVCEAVQ